ncbi:MAG TPA: Os1348 family NHLP clan protein [Anaerolineales bacterium]|nr:Os1348 family NHLP clan protein [Anaerolineales bacterium]
MDFQTLVTKAMSDEKFAEALANNPEKALREAGIEPTAEMLEALKGVDAAAIRKLAQAFGDDKAAAV